jgi:hypothetical protein
MANRFSRGDTQQAADQCTNDANIGNCEHRAVVGDLLPAQSVGIGVAAFDRCKGMPFPVSQADFPQLRPRSRGKTAPVANDAGAVSRQRERSLQ